MNNGPTGFFRAFSGTCCGRTIFASLRHQTWGKTVLHLFILSLITGTVVGGIRSCRVNNSAAALEAAFTETFGRELRIDRAKSAPFSALIPAEDPRKPREIALPGRGRLYYTGTARQVPDSLKDARPFLVIWRPDAFYLVQSEGEKFLIVTQNAATAKMDQRNGSRADVERIFRDAPGALPANFNAMETEKTEALFDAFGSLAGVFLVLWAVGRNFILVWIYTGIFMLMYRVLNGSAGNLRILTPGEMWKCGIYASFPPMVVASFFPALELPFFSFETVFMLGLLIYWMAVMAWIERNPGENEEHNDEH